MLVFSCLLPAGRRPRPDTPLPQYHTPLRHPSSSKDNQAGFFVVDLLWAVDGQKPYNPTPLTTVRNRFVEFIRKSYIYGY